MEVIDLRFESFKEHSNLIIAMPNSRTNKWTHYRTVTDIKECYTNIIDDQQFMPYVYMAMNI